MERHGGNGRKRAMVATLTVPMGGRGKQQDHGGTYLRKPPLPRWGSSISASLCSSEEVSSSAADCGLQREEQS